MCDCTLFDSAVAQINSEPLKTPEKDHRHDAVAAALARDLPLYAAGQCATGPSTAPRFCSAVRVHSLTCSTAEVFRSNVFPSTTEVAVAAASPRSLGREGHATRNISLAKSPRGAIPSAQKLLPVPIPTRTTSLKGCARYSMLPTAPLKSARAAESALAGRTIGRSSPFIFEDALIRRIRRASPRNFSAVGEEGRAGRGGKRRSDQGGLQPLPPAVSPLSR